MGPNIWNALRMQSEFLECTSNIQECTTNFHSDGIRAHSGSSATGRGYYQIPAENIFQLNSRGVVRALKMTQGPDVPSQPPHGDG